MYSSPVKAVFKVSPRIIWLSALFMGILASIPKILLMNISMYELAFDACIAFVFSLFIWYYNLYSLPKFSNEPIVSGFFNRRLVMTLLLGIIFMVLMVSGHQLFFPHYNFQSMILMYQFRGILINLTIYMFLHLLYQGHRTQLMAVELERTKADNLGAQYELLKQQVNPHFLFNSLSTLKSMIELGDEHCADFTHKLSDFYRFTLNKRKSNIISIREELEILNAYMYLLKARFESGLLLHIEIDVPTALSYIPPFTLQLLVENCIKHNIVSLEKPLRISLSAADGFLLLENNLQLKKTAEISTQVGLENINERYQHLINRKIEIESNTDTFKVKLPLIYDYSDH